MYKIALWISIGVVLALVATYQVPRWPTARSTGHVEHCAGLNSPVLRSTARAELERRRSALTQAEATRPGTDAIARLSTGTGRGTDAPQADATYSANRQAEAAETRCLEELASIGSGERLRTERRQWWRVTALLLIVAIGLLVALYFGRIAAIRRRWH